MFKKMAENGDVCSVGKYLEIDCILLLKEITSLCQYDIPVWYAQAANQGEPVIHNQKEIPCDISA